MDSGEDGFGVGFAGLDLDADVPQAVDALDQEAHVRVVGGEDGAHGAGGEEAGIEGNHLEGGSGPLQKKMGGGQVDVGGRAAGLERESRGTGGGGGGGGGGGLLGGGGG